MTENALLVASLECTSLSITSVCADIVICRGGGTSIEVSATTPANWAVSPEGEIVEVGGPLAEALKKSRHSGFNGLNGIRASGNIVVTNQVTSFGGQSQSFRPGLFDGVFYINNEVVAIPEVREQLRISIPAGRICDLTIDSEYFGDIDLQIALQGELTVSATQQIKMSLGDQPNLTSAQLGASMGATIDGKLLTATGPVRLIADMSDSKLSLGNIRGDTVGIRASMGGKINIGNVRAMDELEMEASMSDSRIDCGHVGGVNVTTEVDTGGKMKGKNIGARATLKMRANAGNSSSSFVEVCAETVDLKADMSGKIELDQSNSKRLKAKADMSGRITVARGSAESGKASADMSGRVKLTGDFGQLSKKRDMGGEVLVTVAKGDAEERFTNAGKRGFNRALWGDQHSTAVSMAIAAAMAPMMKQGLGDALDDDTFVGLVCSAMEPAYADAAVDASIRKCGSLFAALVPVEQLQEPGKVQAAFADPAMLESFGLAAQAFMTTTFTKAQELAK